MLTLILAAITAGAAKFTYDAFNLWGGWKTKLTRVSADELPLVEREGLQRRYSNSMGISAFSSAIITFTLAGLTLYSLFL